MYKKVTRIQVFTKNVLNKMLTLPRGIFLHFIKKTDIRLGNEEFIEIYYADVTYNVSSLHLVHNWE